MLRFMKFLNTHRQTEREREKSGDRVKDRETESTPDTLHEHSEPTQMFAAISAPTRRPKSCVHKRLHLWSKLGQKVLLAVMLHRGNLFSTH